MSLDRIALDLPRASCLRLGRTVRLLQSLGGAYSWHPNVHGH